MPDAVLPRPGLLSPGRRQGDLSMPAESVKRARRWIGCERVDDVVADQVAGAAAADLEEDQHVVAVNEADALGKELIATAKRSLRNHRGQTTRRNALGAGIQVLGGWLVGR